MEQCGPLVPASAASSHIPPISRPVRIEFDRLLAQQDPVLAVRQTKGHPFWYRRKPKLAVADRQFVTLMCYRVSKSQAILDSLFGMDPSTIFSRLHNWMFG